MNVYEIWFIPTEKGKLAFGWKEERCKNPNHYTNLDDAELDCYLLNADDPAPDKYEYGKFVIKEVLP